jgi:AcrR family transcriptional regulator
MEPPLTCGRQEVLTDRLTFLRVDVVEAVERAGATAGVDEAGDQDGRRRRSERSRAAVVEALLDLYEDGEVSPGAAEIAARAGVSERSVFRHFEDLDGLAHAAIERQWERVGALYDPPDPDGDRATRITALVEQRVRLHEAVMPVARAAMLLAARSATLRHAIGQRRQLLRAQVEAQFGPELDTLPTSRRAEVVAALDIAAGLDTVESLRSGSRFSRARTRAVMERMIDSLLPEEA